MNCFTQKNILCLISFILFITSNQSIAQTTKKISQAKIVSWNIQMLPNSVAMFSAALRKKQRIREPWIVAFCEEQDYDVIVFQEVFDVDIKRKLKKNLKKSYPYQVDTRTTKGRLTSNGIFIVSRIPMKYLDHVIYQKGAHEDAWAAKGCTLVELEKEGVIFRLAGTHLQSGESEAAIKHRDWQYQDIRNLLDSNHSDSIPVFVLGDMNTEKSNTEKYNKMIAIIEAQDFPLDEEEPYTIDNKNYWNKHSEPVQIDYILLKKQQTNTRILEQKIIRPKKEYKGKLIDFADHYGIVATVEIEN